jgi:hypothetical protein
VSLTAHLTQGVFDSRHNLIISGALKFRSNSSNIPFVLLFPSTEILFASVNASTVVRRTSRFSDARMPI